MKTISTSKENVKIGLPGGLRLECHPNDVKKYAAYGLGVLFVAEGIKFSYRAVLPLVKPSMQEWGEKLKDKFSKRSQNSQNDAPIVSGDQVIHTSEPERKWIIPGILREGDTCVLFAPEKTGKTTLAINWACSINSGVCDISLPNYFPVKVPAIYYNMEMDDCLLNEFIGQNPYFSSLKLVNKRVWRSTDELVENVRTKLENVQSSCVVFIDNLTTCGLNSTADAARALHQSLMNLKEDRLKRHGVHTTIVLITHTIKDAKSNRIDTSDMRGSTVLSSLADVSLGLFPAKEAGQVLLKTVHIRSAAKPEECYLMERISIPGNQHFRFLQMVKEEDAMDKSATSVDEAPEGVRKYKDVPYAEREEMHDFWKAMRNEGNSCEDISYMTLEHFHIDVTRQTVWNFFQAK